MVQMREIEYGNSLAQRTLCVLVLDTSASMSMRSDANNKRRIELLNDGVQAFYNDLFQDETARNRVRLAIVQVGGPNDDAAVMMDWTDAVDFIPMKFKEDGCTPLGEGMLLALELIEQEREKLKMSGISYTRPWIMVMSDGMPTSPTNVWREATEKAQQAEEKKKCIVYPIAIDAGNDEMSALSQLSCMTPPVHMDSAKFREFFVWLSGSLKTMSQSAPGDTVQLASITPWATVKND